MGGYAWVTLATTDSYSLGALVLAHSLKQVGTKHQLAVLITPGVTNPMRNKLREVFDLVEEVNILDSKDEKNLKLLKRPELGITFTKLHCWRLTQYEKCVFLDADTLVLENCDELFERDELSAAPDVGWPDCFNSGVFVYCPSNQTFSNLIQFALDKGSFDGGDQGLLNLYFSDWAHKDISKHLPFIYNMSSTACYSYLPAFKQFGKNAKIVHFIGGTKPWLQYFDIETRTVHPSHELQHMKEVLQYWWNIFCNSVHPNLSNEMSNPSTSTDCGSFLQNVTHTSYYYHYESQNTNVADDYENVWDPWEEYLEKISYNPSSSQLVHHESSQDLSSDQNNPNHSQCHLNEDQYRSNHNPNHYDQNHSYHHNKSSQEVHISDISNSQLIESHNTNTEFAHHYHENHPAYSQSQSNSPTVHYDPPSTPDQKPPMTKPPPPLPCNESIQCVATMIVSNETSLHDSYEDAQNGDSGFAGAFAKLTLGVARTPEQAALDDHLRRQGWEVGNIDYLGRDSFDNIWSKICETLAAAPSEPPKSKEQTLQPEQPKEEATEARKADEAKPAGPVCAIQASTPTKTTVADSVSVLPVDAQTAIPHPKQEEISQAPACPISTPKPDAPTATESAPVCPLAAVTDLPAKICAGPVTAALPAADGPVCPAPTVIPVRSDPPSREDPVCHVPSSLTETPAAICAAPLDTSQPVAQSSAPPLEPQSFASPLIPQSPIPAEAPQNLTPVSSPLSPPPVSVPQSPIIAPVPQSPSPAPTPQSPVSSPTPQSPAPASTPQCPAPAATPQSQAPASTPQSPAPASTPQSPAPASIPQSPAPTSTPQSPAPASTPQSSAPASTPQSFAPAPIPQSPTQTSTPQNPALASTPQSSAPAATPQSPAPALTLQCPAPASSLQSPVPASTPPTPAPASTPQSPAPASTPQGPAPASTTQVTAPASTPQSPAPALSPQSPSPAAPIPVEGTLLAEGASKSKEPIGKSSQTKASETTKGTSVSEASKDSPTEVVTAAAKPLELSQKPQEKPAEQASSDTSGPTPPPRKGSGPKKAGGKGKK